MERILIIGCGGAGKSTFSRKLQKLINYEIIHLDKLYWKPNWQAMEEQKWIELVQDIIKKENWIMDGNYNGTMELRLQRADTVIFFDFPRIICLWNTFKRIIKGKVFKIERKDVTKGCKEKFDFSFFKWIWNYNNKNRPKYMNLLTSLKGKKKIVIFKNYKDVNKFLQNLFQDNSLEQTKNRDFKYE